MQERRTVSSNDRFGDAVDLEVEADIECERGVWIARRDKRHALAKRKKETLRNMKVCIDMVRRLNISSSTRYVSRFFSHWLSPVICVQVYIPFKTKKPIRRSAH